MSLCSSSGGAVYAEVANQVQCRGSAAVSMHFVADSAFWLLLSAPLSNPAVTPFWMFASLRLWFGECFSHSLETRIQTIRWCCCTLSTQNITRNPCTGVSPRYQFRRGVCNAHLHQAVFQAEHWQPSSGAVRLRKRCTHSSQYSVCTKVLQQSLEPDVGKNGVECNDAHHRRDAVHLHQTNGCDDSFGMARPQDALGGHPAAADAHCRCRQTALPPRSHERTL
jgi:hypothetical protein